MVTKILTRLCECENTHVLTCTISFKKSTNNHSYQHTQIIKYPTHKLSTKTQSSVNHTCLSDSQVAHSQISSNVYKFNIDHNLLGYQIITSTTAHL